MTLLAVPNFSEGRDQRAIAAITAALGNRARLLDTHSDPDHHRTVCTLTGTPAELVDALLEGAAAAIRHIRLPTHSGVHPRVGALDVAPLVFTEAADRGAACAAALAAGDRLGAELGLPVFLYGLLSDHTVSRAAVRRGGPSSLASRLVAGDATPDFGPAALHPSAGATLVAARPPLIAFNLELAPGSALEDARAVVRELRDLPGVTALAFELGGGIVQVSTNLEAPELTSPAAVTRHVAARTPVTAAEIVGLASRRHFEDFPADLELRRHRMLEEALLS